MKKYSVLLLYPDYIATTYPDETYLAHVDAESVDAAVALGQAQAARDGAELEDAENFHPLLVTEGHIEDVKP